MSRHLGSELSAKARECQKNDVEKCQKNAELAFGAFKQQQHGTAGVEGVNHGRRSQRAGDMTPTFRGKEDGGT